FMYYSLIGIVLAYPLTIVLRTSSLPALVVAAGILTSVMGTGGVMLAYLAELFPTRYRGSAIGFLWNMASIGATGALLTAPFWLRGLGLVMGYVVMLIVGFLIAIVGTAITKDNTGIELKALDEKT
ncbi:MAG: MFS transporter, partial [Vulcanisaeta sp.]